MQGEVARSAGGVVRRAKDVGNVRLLVCAAWSTIPQSAVAADSSLYTREPVERFLKKYCLWVMHLSAKFDIL